MSINYSSDITFDEMTNSVLRELHEPEGSGSEAVPLELVKDKLNESYARMFTDQRMKQSARETTVTFVIASDALLDSYNAAGVTTLTVNNSATFRNSGKLLIGSEIVSYTGNTGTGFTGVSATAIEHFGGEIVRQLYPLSSLASGIDVEQIQLLNVNGIPYHYKPYERLIGTVTFDPLSFTVFQGNLLLSQQGYGGAANGSSSKGFMVFTSKVVPMVNGTDKPTLIPNEYRMMLVYDACMKIAASDAFRTSWDFWKAERDDMLAKYIAFMNCRVQDRQNKVRPSVYRYLP